MKLFQSKLGKICICKFRCLCLFSSRRIWIFQENPSRTPQKVKNDCSLFIIKTCFNFSISHPRYFVKYSIISRLYKKLINLSETMRSKHFQNSQSFKRMQSFKTKVCVILDCLSFCKMLFSQKLKLTAEKQYIITDGMRWDVFYCYRKNERTVRYL